MLTKGCKGLISRHVGHRIVRVRDQIRPCSPSIPHEDKRAIAEPLEACGTLDFVAAFAFGIAFQYFTIKPVRKLYPWRGLIAALKADSLYLTSWQVGMYGWMAVVTFLIFGHELDKTTPTFWFMMQIAMLAGFLTAFPVNWWLVRSGIKERMQAKTRG